MTIEKKSTKKYNRNVRVSDDTLRKINILKFENGLANHDSVIQFLMQQKECEYRLLQAKADLKLTAFLCLLVFVFSYFFHFLAAATSHFCCAAENRLHHLRM